MLAHKLEVMAKLFIAKRLCGVRGFAQGSAVRIRQGLAKEETPVIDTAGTAEELHIEEPPAIVAAEVCFRAAPFVVNCLLNQGCAHRIGFDLVEGRPKVRLSHRARVETVLPEVAGTMASGVEVLGETAVHTAQQDGEGIFLRRDGDEMYVVRHQAVSEDAYFGVCGLFAKEIEVDEVIGTSSEDDSAGGSALGDLMGHSVRDEAGSSRRSVEMVLAGLPESQGKPRWDELPPFLALVKPSIYTLDFTRPRPLLIAQDQAPST